MVTVPVFVGTVFFLHGEGLEVFMQNMVDALWVAVF